jgi:hypothetical protein
MRLHNKTILDKPSSTLTPYSTNAKTFSGSGFVVINQNYRNSACTTRYSLLLYFHYAPDAAYLKINPMVQLSIREKTFRTTKAINFISTSDCKQRKGDIIIDNSTENYSVFNAKYYNTKTEVTNHLSLLSDLQISGKFGKFC